MMDEHEVKARHTETCFLKNDMDAYTANHVYWIATVASLGALVSGVRLVIAHRTKTPDAWQSAAWFDDDKSALDLNATFLEPVKMPRIRHVDWPMVFDGQTWQSPVESSGDWIGDSIDLTNEI
jgi:hypothetical protein